jgi:DNA-binding LacI/PurR family transcriptional regulator
MLVIIEESYKITAWCREIIDSLRSEARKKRINLVFSSNLEDVLEPNAEKAVILVGSETDWLKLAVAKVKSCEKHPIVLSNQSDSALGGGVSQVTEDIEGSMKEICEYFAQKGKKRIALYAANPASASDEYRRKAFLSFGGKSEDVFSNEGSLALCFENFIKSFEEKGYNGIICSNDFAAISLFRHMMKIGKALDSIEMISYSNTLISHCFSPSISSVKANYGDFGQMAFMIADCLSKSEAINGIHIFGKWEIVHRETSSPISSATELNEKPPQQSAHPGKFYEDSELLEMVRLENMLSECDSTDIEILKMIIEEKKLSEIEESSFLTETAIKYRIRKMKEICRAESRSQLRDVLAKYVCSDKLSALKL